MKPKPQLSQITNLSSDASVRDEAHERNPDHAKATNKIRTDNTRIVLDLGADDAMGERRVRKASAGPASGPLLRLPEVQAELKIGKTTLYKLLNEKLLRAVKLFDETRVRSEDLDEFKRSLPAYDQDGSDD